MTLRLSRAADYAILAMMHLGSLPEGDLAVKRDIARAQNIPACYLGKILGRLVNAGVLRSTRGTTGGFGLRRSAALINLLDIVEGIEGPIQMIDCAPDPDHGPLSHDSPVSGLWLEVQRRTTELLRKTTLEAMMSAPSGNRRAAYKLGA
jgi:Rrf2 family protein